MQIFLQRNQQYRTTDLLLQKESKTTLSLNFNNGDAPMLRVAVKKFAHPEGR